MDNNSQPNIAGLPPAVDNTPKPEPTPGQQQPVQPQPSQTGVELDSPILMPTHFDDIQQQQGAVPTIVPEGEGVKEEPAPNTPTIESMKKKATGYMILSIVLGIAALTGILMAVIGFVNSGKIQQDLDEANETIEAKQAIIAKVESETGTKIESADNVPAYKPVLGWIYITQWGVKLKIPDDLTNVSYIVNANDFDRTQTVCFNATKKGVKYFPEFANVTLNPGGMGCLARIASYEGDIDKDTGISFGQKVFTYGDYSYFYQAPTSIFSNDEANAGLEATAVQILKNMISNNIEHYE